MSSLPGHLTVIISLILANSPSLMPLTFMTSSMVLNGRPSMIAAAQDRSDTRKASSSSLEAVFRLTFWPALSLGMSLVGCIRGRVVFAVVLAVVVLAAAGVGRDQVFQCIDSRFAEALDALEIVDRLERASRNDGFGVRRTDARQVFECGGVSRIEIHFLGFGFWLAGTVCLGLGLGGGSGFSHVNLGANGGYHLCRDACFGEIVDFGIGAAGDDLLGGGRADARKLFELFGGGFVQVDGICSGCLLLGGGFLRGGLGLDGDARQDNEGAHERHDREFREIGDIHGSALVKTKAAMEEEKRMREGRMPCGLGGRQSLLWASRNAAIPADSRP